MDLYAKTEHIIGSKVKSASIFVTRLQQICQEAKSTYNYRGQVFTFESSNCQFQRLVHGHRDALGDQAIEVDGPAQELGAQGEKSINNRNKHGYVCISTLAAASKR